MDSRNSPLHAQPGDHLVVRGHHQGEPERDAEVLKALGEGGGVPYVKFDVKVPDGIAERARLPIERMVVIG